MCFLLLFFWGVGGVKVCIPCCFERLCLLFWSVCPLSGASYFIAVVKSLFYFAFVSCIHCGRFVDRLGLSMLCYGQFVNVVLCGQFVNVMGSLSVLLHEHFGMV